jgi:lipopolysaccharide biosynthesis glycosyltransferase
MRNLGEVGIYCLANDKVLEWMLPFLESVRTYEPDCPLYIVPFNDDISRLAQLAEKYNFQFYSPSSLEILDEVGAKVRGVRDIHNHRFRIFSIFWGELDHFLFLDSDIIVLSQLDELFKVYLDSDYQFMPYYKGIHDQVYKEGEFRQKMLREYTANGFNAGSFLSSKGVFSLEDIEELAEEAAQIRQYFADNCIVQPFVNYCVDRKRLKTQAIADSMPNLASEWAKFDIEYVNNSYQINGKKVLYTHWAGFGHNPSMPNRQIFLDYRLKNSSWLERWQYIINDQIRSNFRSFKSTIAKTLKG